MGADERDVGLPAAACACSARTLQKAWPARENIRGQPSSSALNPFTFLLFASKRLHKHAELRTYGHEAASCFSQCAVLSRTAQDLWVPL